MNEQDPVAVWREALKDSSHPRHRVAWLLFPDRVNIKAAAKQLADQKEEVIGYLYEILDTDALYNMESLGRGNAPINAVELLGEWQITEAVPRLLRILEEKDWGTKIHDRTVAALGKMGPQSLDTLLAYMEDGDPDVIESLIGTVSDIAEGDPRVFEMVKARLDQAEEEKDEWDIRYMAENLLVIDAEKAIALLEERIKARRYHKRLREILREYIANAREKGMS